MAEAAVSLVIDQLSNFLLNEAKLLSGVHKQVSSIKSELEFIQCFLKEADERAETEENSDGIKVWVTQVRKLAYLIEDVIEEYVLHLARRRQPPGFISCLHKITFSIFKLKRRHDIASQIQEIETDLVEIKSRAERYGFSSLEKGSSSGAEHSTWHDPRMASLFIEEDQLVGIESDRDELISRLVTGESKRVVISVVGMGGVGKTTLAKKVYDSQTVTSHFDCCAWITVSQSYKPEDLLREMINQFHESRKDSVPEAIDAMGETSLVSKLREYLEPKRYVVSFDDVWRPDFWRFIKNALPNNNKGSRVFITTRSEDVASSCKESSLAIVHKIRPLNEEKAWELFCKKTFQSNTGECSPELKALSLEIVRRCEGLPLAIVAIGGLLSTKNKVVSEWQKICHNLGSELERNPHLTSMKKIVLLSYHDLPYYLKYCFLYLGTLPEDYSIFAGTLIFLWIAEGFVKEEKSRTLEEVGKEYLNELMHRNLVQVSNVRHETYRVHDLVRETILLKFEELNFCQVLSDKNPIFDPQTRRISIHNSMDNYMEIISNSSHIRSVCIYNVNRLPESSLDRLVSNFKLMRVLDLVNTPLNYLPEEVGTLIHLRYLSARNSKIKSIPRSIGRLQNLQILNMAGCPVYELPEEIYRLRKLRHFIVFYEHRISHIFDDRRAVKIEKRIGNLELLQTLAEVDVNDDDGVSPIKELGNLRQLRHLGIKNLKRENGRALCNSIEKMTLLNVLQVWATSEEEIIDLQYISSPPQYLRSLFLGGHLEKLFDWIPKLQNLGNLSLNWSRLSDDPLKALQNLPNLLLLRLYKGYDGERLFFEANGFRKLNNLILLDLNGLSSLIIEQGALPLLKEMCVGSTLRLKEVPSGIRYLTKLKRLELHNMPQNFLDRMKPPQNFLDRMNPYKGQDYWIVQHISAVRIYIKDAETGVDECYDLRG